MPPPARTFRLDREAHRLWAGDRALEVPPKVLRLLGCLVEHAGKVVGHAQLQAEVWSDVRVSRDAVRYAVRELRKVLGERADAPEYVETVPRVGWRFVGEVAAEPDGTTRLEPRARLEAASASAPPHVGRAEERDALTDALARAERGERQLVLVTGEAGIGKTTLVEGFLAGLGTRAPAVGRGRCIEHYGPSEAYLPVLEALERLCGSFAGRDAVEVLRRFAPMWLSALPSLTEPGEREALQREIEGATQLRMVREFAQALEALADLGPLILWIDDLHWCDVSSLEALSLLLHRDTPASLLVIGAYRPADASPELRALQRNLARARHAETHPLGFLGAAEVEEYLLRRFPRASGPSFHSAVGRFVHVCTEGNPLFMVGVVDDLVADGVVGESGGVWELRRDLDRAQAPATVHALFERELDRLGAAEREILDAASIAGMRFSAAALEPCVSSSVEAVEGVCDRLAAEGSFLSREGAVEWPDGTAASGYAFVHALHRQVISGRLGAARRARLERDVGLRKERAFEGSAEDVAVELAAHFEAGRDLERAIAYRQLAGERAARRFANQEAAQHLRKALELLDRLPAGDRRDQLEIPLRLTINVPLAATGGYASPELEANLVRFQELTRGFGEAPPLFPVLLGLWSLTIVRADLETAVSIGERLLRIADGERDRIALLQAHRVLGHTLFYRGELEEARRHLEASLDGYDVSAHQRLDYSYGDDPVVLSLSYASWSLWFRGLPAEAVARGEQALAIGERLEHPPSRAFARFYAAILHQLRQDPARCLDAADSLLDVATREGMQLWIALGTFLRGWALAESGDVRDGVAAVDAGIAAWEATGSALGGPYFLSVAAEVRVRHGRADEAAGLLARIDAELARTGQDVFQPMRERLDGVLRAEAGDAAGAEAAFRRALEVAARHGTRSLALRAALPLAELLAAGGRAAEARVVLESARAALVGADAEPEAIRADALLTRLSSSRGRT